MKKILLFLANEVMQVLEMVAVLCTLSYIMAIIVITGFSMKILASLWVAWLVLLTLCVIIFIIWKKITSFPIDDNRIAILIYHKDGRLEHYRKPMWGKFDYKTIYFPPGWGVKKLLSHDFRVSLTLETLEREVIIPFNLKFEIGDYFDAITLHEIISWQDDKPGQRIFKFNECIQNIFVKFNLSDDEQKRKLEALAGHLFSAIVNKAATLEMIKKEVGFPDQIFKTRPFVSLLRADIKVKLFDKEQIMHI